MLHEQQEVPAGQDIFTPMAFSILFYFHALQRNSHVLITTNHLIQLTNVELAEVLLEQYPHHHLP